MGSKIYEMGDESEKLITFPTSLNVKAALEKVWR